MGHPTPQPTCTCCHCEFIRHVGGELALVCDHCSANGHVGGRDCPACRRSSPPPAYPRDAKYRVRFVVHMRDCQRHAADTLISGGDSQLPVIVLMDGEKIFRVEAIHVAKIESVIELAPETRAHYRREIEKMEAEDRG